MALQLIVVESPKCVGCKSCVRLCGEGALEIDSNTGKVRVIAQEKCVQCGKCEDMCPTEALHLIEHPRAFSVSLLIQTKYSLCKAESLGIRVDGTLAILSDMFCSILDIGGYPVGVKLLKPGENPNSNFPLPKHSLRFATV